MRLVQLRQGVFKINLSVSNCLWLVENISDHIGADRSFGTEWTLGSTLTTMFITSLNETTVCLTLKLISKY